MELTIHNNPDANRFEVSLPDDQMAFIEYQIAKKNILYTHTEVPPAFEGQGVGGKLAKYALDFARDNGYKVQALCPFVKAYVQRHPEYHAITWGF